MNRLLIQHAQDGSQRGWRRRARPRSRSSELRFLDPDRKLAERILLLGREHRFGGDCVFTRCLPLRMPAEPAMQQRLKRLGDSDKADAQPPFFAARRGGLRRGRVLWRGARGHLCPSQVHVTDRARLRWHEPRHSGAAPAQGGAAGAAPQQWPRPQALARPRLRLLQRRAMPPLRLWRRSAPHARGRLPLAPLQRRLALPPPRSKRRGPQSPPR